jgi:hypothetical protein
MDINNKSKSNLKTFYQHGFEEIEEIDIQVRGYCPFCNGDKFYINYEIKGWDCKHCGRNGGYQRFLQQITEYCKEQFKGDIIKSLHNNRSISSRLLKSFDIGYNPKTKKYTIPMYNRDKSKVSNIYIFTPNAKKFKMIGTYGGEQDLIGVDKFDPKAKIIWLTEGHWDYLVMSEILENLEKEDETVLAVPGVNQLKDTWVSYFKGKNVFVLYDNDHDQTKGGKIVNPSREGQIKVYNKLKLIANELKFIQWENDLKDGYDIRDLYKDNKLDYTETYTYIVDRLDKYPKGMQISSVDIKEKKEKSEIYTGEKTPYNQVYEKYQKWLKLRNTEIIDVFYGSLIANRLPGDPIWLLIVGQSGCGKSAMIMSIKDAEDIYSIDTLTKNTLVSGAHGIGGSDPSLIPQLDKKILAIKDFTTILDMHPNDRDEIFAQLRSAYDGEFNKPFGIGILRAYVSKFGIIGGVTRAIELYTEGSTALGERFLRYHFPMSNTQRGRFEVMHKALQNITSKQKDIMQKELREIGTEVLSFNYENMPEMDNDFTDKLVALSDWTSMLRGTVMRDKYTKEITHKAFIEIGTRLVTQLGKLSFGIGMFRGVDKLDKDIYATVKEVARSSIPTKNEEMIKKLYFIKGKNELSVNELSEIIGLPAITVQRIAENLCILGALVKTKILGTMVSKYSLSKEIKGLIEKIEMY